MLLTLANLKALVAKHDLTLQDIASAPAPRVVCERWGDVDARLMLEVHIYATTEDGRRYLDAGTGEAAVEVRLLPFEILTPEGWPTVEGENGRIIGVPHMAGAGYGDT